MELLNSLDYSWSACVLGDMQWTTELADNWDDAPANPPTVPGARLEMNWVGEGFVLCRASEAGEPLSREYALFSTVACKVENDTTDQVRTEGRETAESPES